ncbi:MAG: hypothetical protein NNA18_04820 [Nitrospira sp.]|nr:hypothetical protein [Nitrospira sp.]
MNSYLELSALDGANPLGFLAALGTLSTLHKAGQTNARLGWKRAVRWTPVLKGITTEDPKQLSDMLAQALRGRTVASDAEERRKAAQQSFDAAKKMLRDKRDEIKKRHLRGEERKKAVETEIRPLEETLSQKRQVWLSALKDAVPRPELALGKHLDCTRDEFREHSRNFLESANHTDRQVLDLLANFGSDVCTKDQSDRIEATPFCFITGSGHQYFLDTVRELIGKVMPERVYAALFKPWAYQEETLSMRWDPIEDRRYALMDRDPTANDNKPRTVWMANLLAYHGLVFFPSTPTTKRLSTTSWSHINKEKEPSFTWPIWEAPIGPDTIRTILQVPDLCSAEPSKLTLRALGIAAVFRSRRIRVGEGANFKINFSHARALL